MEQKEAIKKFCENANYYLVRFPSKTDEDFGKILQTTELDKVKLDEHEIYRSIEYTNGDMLFVLDLKKDVKNTYSLNHVQLLLKNLEDAKSIEIVYPKMFTWIYDGLSIKAYAVVPSGNVKQHSTISRYGGTLNFIKTIRQHLKNIASMKRGVMPDYNFVNNDEEVETMELSIGSINKFSDLYSVHISPFMSFADILRRSKNGMHADFEFTYFDMKYWTREINPDFLADVKNIKITDTLTIDEAQTKYPAPVIRLMNLKHKGNYNRFLLARFLLSIHSPKDAKFMYYSVLGNEEREHVKSGNCSTQWNYIKNNIKHYSCPTMKELKSFIHDTDPPLSHPLENIQEYLDKKKVKKNE